MSNIYAVPKMLLPTHFYEFVASIHLINFMGINFHMMFINSFLLSLDTAALTEH